jgi:hypothetical protein
VTPRVNSAFITSGDTWVVQARFDPSLRACLLAIPGRRWHSAERAWSIRLGPDRADAVVRLLEAFPWLSTTVEDQAVVEGFRGCRDLARPVIEHVQFENAQWLSVCGDWASPLLSDLKDVGRFVSHDAIGRLSLLIEAPGRRALVDILSRHEVRLSPRAYEVLGCPAGVPMVGLVEGHTRDGVSPRVIPPRPWAASLTTAVLDGAPWFAFTTTAGRVPKRLINASRVRVIGDTVLVPMDRQARNVIAEVLRTESQVTVALGTARCLDVLDSLAEVDVPPPALLTADADDGGLGLEILWGEELRSAADALPEVGHPRESAIDHHVRADAFLAPAISTFAAEHGVHVDEAARRLLDRLEIEHQVAEATVLLSSAVDGDLDVPRLGGELMGFQRAGVAYALRQRRTFIADEQGLGKTVQALAALEADNAYPAVIVCPASLKLNWRREAERWLPHRTTQVLDGRRATAVADGGDLVLVNYDVLDAYVEALADRQPAALVLDEAHYCKNANAKRTKAAIALSERLDAGAMRLALTGTPLVNRPRELASQLRILGRLEEFDSSASFERTYRGAAARDRLHWHLRRRCYVRRRKQEVLPQLPAKRRVTVPLPLDNDAEYQRLEHDLVAWLQTVVADTDVLRHRLDAAMRAKALVKLNALRHVAARGKLKAAIAWIGDFIEADEKLVVFAHHRDVQQALLKAFPTSARIIGGDDLDQRDANVQAFQASDGPSLCVCSLEVASHGFTLTAASNVAFVELGWTPAKHDQAEDRVHRIGQDRKVNAYYLLAADTIDERMAALIEHKRAIVTSVTDGGHVAEESVVDRLILGLVEQPTVSLAA